MFKKSKTRRKKTGIYIGQKKGVFNTALRLFDADRSVVIPSDYSGPIGISGGSGSGKTTCMVLTSLCDTYQDGTFFAIDPKGDVLSAYREACPGEVVKVFSLRGETEYTYEPFEYIREAGDFDLVSNMRELVNSLLPLPPNGNGDFWVNSAREYLTGGFLYYYDLGLSFIDSVENIMTTPPTTLITKIGKCTNPMIRSFVNNFLGNGKLSDNKMLIGVCQEVTNRLSIIANDPRVRQALSPSEKQIRWTDLNNDNIFYSVPEDRLEQYGPVIAMMITQLIRSLERRHEKHSLEGADQRQILLMLDEMARLGKIDVLQSAVSTLRSKNVIICLVFQSLAQLDAVYGQDVQRIILDNCSYLAVFSANDVQSEKYFSDKAGTRLVKRIIRNTNYERVSDSINPFEPSKITSYSEQVSEHREICIRPEEFSTLKDIVFFTPNGYERVKKTNYHKVDTVTKVQARMGKVFGKIIDTVTKVRACTGKVFGKIKNFFGFGKERALCE